MACYTSTTNNNKLCVLFIPFLATSHIKAITEFAVHLAAADEAVEATVAVTPANVSIVQSLLGCGQPHNVKIATYPFPTVDGIPKGVENMANASTPEVSLDIEIIVSSEPLMRPVQETLIRAADAIVTDMLFIWNGRVADELGIPCVAFSSMGAFSTLAVRHLMDVAIDDNNEVPGFPCPRIRIPRSELPVFFRIQDYSFTSSMDSLQANCFGLAMNTSSDLEKQYCEMYMRNGYVKRAYFVGPLTLGLGSSSSSSSPVDSNCYIMDWLDSKPNHSVVYISFGSLAHFKDAQLDEIALGLENSEKSFLWVVNGKEEWSPPHGLGLQHRGLIIRAWAPQTTILRHPAVGAFVTHCGWNSILETVAAGVPVLTWPGFYEQFITERQVTEVLGIGERLWPDGAGLRSERPEEHEVVPGADVARALTTFMRPGGPGDAARIKVKNLAGKVHAAMAEGGSSHRDLHRLISDLMAAKSISRRKSKI